MDEAALCKVQKKDILWSWNEWPQQVKKIVHCWDWCKAFYESLPKKDFIGVLGNEELGAHLSGCQSCRWNTAFDKWVPGSPNWRKTDKNKFREVVDYPLFWESSAPGRSECSFTYCEWITSFMVMLKMLVKHFTKCSFLILCSWTKVTCYNKYWRHISNLFLLILGWVILNVKHFLIKTLS